MKKNKDHVAMIIALNIKDGEAMELILNNDNMEPLYFEHAHPYVSTSFNEVMIPISDATVHLMRAVITGAHDSLVEYNDIMNGNYKLMLRVKNGTLYVQWALRP